jgi:hypothetical protein
MKKGRCCLTSFILIIALIGGIIAAGYFGGNYLIEKYLGPEGELLRLNINNWEELIDFIMGAKNMLSGRPEIDDADKPSQENLDAAKAELENSIIGYDPETGELGNVVFKSPLRLTGGQFAALLQERMAAQEGGAPVQFEIGQVKLEVDSTKTGCIITITLIIPKDNLVEPIKQQLGVVGEFIAGGLSDVYLTTVNKMVLDNDNPGNVKIDDTFEGRDTYIGEKDESSTVNDQILSVIVMLFGGQDASDLNTGMSNMVVDAINHIGSVTFDYEDGVSYLVFDNAYNNDLISQLVDIAELDIDDYSELQEEGKQILSNVKTETNNLLRNLANTPLDAATTPTKAQVQSAIEAVTEAFEDFTDAYQTNPATVNLTILQDAVGDLKDLLNPPL